MTSEAFNNLPRVTTTGAQNMGLTVLLKGFAGGGKSTAATGFPEPVFYIHADKNRRVAAQAKARGRDIEIIPLEDWTQYEDIIIPEIRARNVQAKTIVVDDASSLAYSLIEKERGRKKRPDRDDYTAVLRAHLDTISSMTDAALPKGDHPGYNVVFTSRIRENTDGEGKLLDPGYQCCMWGQFKDHIESFFNYVLLCEASYTTAKGSTKPIRQFKIYSVPPNRYHICKGGELPSEIVVPEGKSAFDLLNEYLKVKE